MAQAPRRKPAAKARPRTPPLEWASAAIGAVLALAALALVGREAVSGDRSAPSITLTVDSVSRAPGGYLVAFTAANRGGSPAAQVVVEGELRAPGAEAETTEASFDYIPDHSTRKGGLFFDGDPGAGALTLKAKGFTEP